MAKTINRLSVTKITKALEPGMYHDGSGLYLQVGPTGAKSWSLKYQLNGRARQMGLGRFIDFGLAEARERARLARQKVADGFDPIDERAITRSLAVANVIKATTFKQATEKYISAHSAGWKSVKHGAQWLATLTTYAFPVIGSLDVAHIETSHVLKILEPIWTTKSETAGRVRGRIESVLDWAKARHLRTGENPARLKGHLDHILPSRAKIAKVKHHEAMNVDDLPAFIAKLRELTSVSARALEFCILTGARTGEVIGATESEIDRNASVWVIPANRMKAGREHRVPLCHRALEILATVPREAGNAHLFCGAKATRGLSNMALLELLKGMAPGLTVHGFRSSFRDWAGDRTSFPREVIEAALAHGLKDKTEAAYRRSDALEKRRRLMQSWEDFLSAPTADTAAPGGNVVAIRA